MLSAVRRSVVAVAAGSTLMWVSVASAQAQMTSIASERLSDKEVKTIIEDLDQARDRFADQLDSKVKSSVIRSPNGEVSVEKYLDDLQDNVKHLKDRFNRDYSASKEAETVLKQGSEIQTHLASQGTGTPMKGSSEWDHTALEMKRLAVAYGTTFPVPPGATVRRINDAEAASTADSLAKLGDELKKSINDDTTLPKPARDSAKSDADAFVKAAKAVKSKVEDSKPATAETKQLLTLADKLGNFAKPGSVGPGVTKAWSAMQAPLDLLRQAYGL
jgi:hypothetical protein